MDPNHGAYCFKSKEDFLGFYIVAAKRDKLNFTNYQLTELVYDESNIFAPQKSYQGKIRTLLTGEKYRDLSVFVRFAFFLLIVGFHAAIGTLIGLVLGSIMLSGSGCLAMAYVGAIISCGLALLAQANDYRGLLCVTQYSKECWCRFTNWIQTEPPSNTEPSHGVGAHGIGNATDSTASILDGFSHDNDVSGIKTSAKPDHTIRSNHAENKAPLPQFWINQKGLGAKSIDQLICDEPWSRSSTNI